MSKDFLGTGWTFPIQVDKDGAISSSSQEDKVREAV